MAQRENVATLERSEPMCQFSCGQIGQPSQFLMIVISHPERGVVYVDEIVAVKALWNQSEPQLSIARPQRIQSNYSYFHLISIDFNKPQNLVRDQVLYLLQPL
jgi:hypothetical protein